MLHPEGPSREPKFCRLPLLEEWPRTRPGVEVVMSSSWHEVHPLQELVSFFPEDLQSRVVGFTPVFSRIQAPSPAQYRREAEVRQWMRDSAEPWRDWVAVDDQAWLFRPFCERLVLCDRRVGLTKERLEAIKGRLADLERAEKQSSAPR